jgi:Kef-type K+ transport system membrane component KefB
VPLLSRSNTHRVGSVVFAAIDFLVVIAPSVVLAVTARQGGLPQSHGYDLVIASSLIGAIHAAIVWSRLRDETRHAHRVIDVWISEFDSLVVLALGATMLLLFVLGGFAEQHAVMVNNGWPVIALWAGVQVTAVLISEVTGRLLFRWLEEKAERDDRDDILDYLRTTTSSPERQRVD